MDYSLIGEIIALDASRLSALRLVRELELPEGAIAGDFVRCAVFDHIHEHPEWTQLSTIDVVYYDPHRADSAIDDSIEGELIARASRKPWRVRNLARVKPDAKSLSEALDLYLATAAAVAVRLDSKERIEVIAPHGVDDLVRGLIRPINSRHTGALRRQLEDQKWRSRYPQLRIDGFNTHED